MTSDGGTSGSGLRGSSSLIGQIIGDFKIIEEIGRGGMGIVFRAHQVSLDRSVALKILSNTLTLTDQAVLRFRREAQATAKLHHPNIVPIYAQGQDGDTYYYAMELVSGASLHDIIAELRAGKPSISPGRSGSGTAILAGGSSMDVGDFALAETELINRDERATPGEQGNGRGSAASPELRSGAAAAFPVHDEAYFDEIARQLRDVADALDYAHRSGVVHRDIKPHNLLVGDGGRLCLSDFGLARVLEQPGVTVTGEFVGSPLYMAPEQITGDRGPVTASADIYSLGATLYEWMTLMPPFPGTSREQVISAVVGLDATDPRQRNPRVPYDLATICLKALEKDPARRYRSAADMRDDLQRFLRRDEIKARRAGVVETTVKLLSRKRTAVIIAAAAVVIFALSSLLFKERRAGREREQTIVAKTDEIESVEREREKLAEQLEDEKESKAQIVDFIERRIDIGRKFASALGGGSALSGLLATDDSNQDAYKPISIGQRIGAMYLVGLREAEMHRLRNVDRASIQPGSAEEHYLRALPEQVAKVALAHLDRSLAADPGFAPARLLRAWINCQLGDFKTMAEDAEAVLVAQADDGLGYAARAAARLLTGQFDATQQDIGEAKSRLGGDYRLDVMEGLALAGQRRQDAALAALSRALVLQPDCITALQKRAELNLAQGHVEVAIADLTRVLDIEARNADALEMRGACFDRLEQYEDARKDYLEAYTISARFGLLAKVAASAANLEEQQQVAAEDPDANAEQEPPREMDVDAPPLPPPGDSSAVQEWLESFLEGGEPQTTSRSLPLSIPNLRIARW